MWRKLGLSPTPWPELHRDDDSVSTQPPFNLLPKVFNRLEHHWSANRANLAGYQKSQIRQIWIASKLNLCIQFDLKIYLVSATK